jgi:streptogramin lyase
MKKMKKIIFLLLFAIVGWQQANAQIFAYDGLYYYSTAPNVVSVVGIDLPTENVTIPEQVFYEGNVYTVTSIGDYAFFYNNVLTSVTIPSTVNSIGAGAFQQCTGLTSVTIPSSVSSIALNTFYGCTGLTSITIPNTVTSIGTGVFNGCSGLTSVTLPDSITSIESYTFMNCTNLTSITIPNSVTSIGDQVFSNCYSLTSIKCDIVTPLSINSDVFGNVNQGACALIVPVGSVTAYQVAPVWQNFSPITVACTPTDNTTTITACNSYTWNGTTYTTSGVYTGTTTNCITEKLDLTITSTPAPTAIGMQVYAGNATITSMNATGTSIQWYEAVTGGVALATTTALTDGTTYFASQSDAGGCESTRVAVTVRKISEATQTFCPSETVTNLVSTPSAGAIASWFTAPSGGTAVLSSEALSTGTYYLEQRSPSTAASVGSGFSFPYGVAVQADGKIIVADLFNNAVKRMNVDGTDIVTLGSGFNLPSSVAVQADGKILVTDFGNQLVKRMNADGTDIVTLGSGFGQPISVAVQADGKILVAAFTDNAIKRMNADGTDIVTLGSGFSGPSGVAVQADGKIVVGDFNNSAVKRMNADGTDIVTLGSGFSNPIGVAVQADGKIVVADYGNSAIKRMNADGTGIVSLGSGFSNPCGVTVQADGTIVVADSGNNAIKRISEGSVSNRVAVSVTITPTTWDGTTWSCGAPTATMDAIINGAYTTSTNGTISAKSLTVNATTGNLTIDSATNVTVQNAVVNNGTLTIENNANLIQVNDVANTGTATVKRNSNSLKRLDYTMWSSPVTGTQTLSDFSFYTTPTRFYTYNPANDKYTGAPASNPFVMGTGYLIRMPDQKPGQLGNTTDYYRGLENLIYNGAFTGKPNNGTITLNSLASEKYYAIGNPYPSTISADAFLDGNATDGTLYFWRKTNGVLGTAYATYTRAGGIETSAGNGGIGAPNGTIQVGQGFIVKTGTAATSLTFTNAMRTTESGSQFFKTKAATDKSRVWLSLRDTKSSLNQTMIAYMGVATLGIDAGYDGKYINDSKIALTSSIEGQEYIIQARPTFDATDVVALNFKTDVAGNYSIALDKFDGLFENGYDVYLVDAVSGKETDLKTEAYTFTATVGEVKERFSLKYQKTLKVDAPVFNENSVTVFRNNAVLTVNSTSKTIKTIQVYDVQGRLVAQQKNVNATKASFNNLKTASQVLIVKVIADDNTVVSKKVLN